MKLYKTTIVVWSEYNGNEADLEDLAFQATEGNAICTKQESVLVESDEDEEADAINSFFGDEDDYDDDDSDDDDRSDENLGQCD